MADWYISSVAYDAVAVWQAATTYAVGNIVRQTSAAYPTQRCFRASSITTGISGGGEPTWNLGLNATTADSGVTWTECTGQSAYQHQGGVTNTWTAPARHFENLDSNGNGGPAAGDRLFTSSDHNESFSSGDRTLTTAGTVAAPLICTSVNRTSPNIPPVASDITIGAVITNAANTATLFLGNNPVRWEGFTFVSSGTGNCFIQCQNSSSGTVGQYQFRNCKFVISGAGSGSAVVPNAMGTSASCQWVNCTVKFGATGQSIQIAGTSSFQWKNTATVSAIDAAGSLPTTLFTEGGSGSGKGKIDIQGVDLSAVTGTLFGTINYLPASVQNCKVNTSATLATQTSGAYGNAGLPYGLEFINCHNTNDGYNNVWYKFGGVISTETTITATGGATDGVQKASRKMISSTSSSLCNKYTPLEHHIYYWNTSIGAVRTATVEIISSGTLNNDEIWGEIQYLGNSADGMSLFANNTVATILTTAANQTASTAAWDSSPSTPVTQKLAISFTAQKVGLIDFVVKLAKTSTTVYVDHRVTVS